MLHGATVTLYERTKTDRVDAFGAPVYTETPVEVEDILIGEPTADESLTATQVYGKVTRYMLGIPRGDRHDWSDARVTWTTSHGQTVEALTFGAMITGVSANIPGKWDAKVRCTDYGG